MSVPNSEHLFVRKLAPFTRLSGEGSSIREILIKMETLAGISRDNRVSGSRTTRHNAASVMLRSGSPYAKYLCSPWTYRPEYCVCLSIYRRGRNGGLYVAASQRRRQMNKTLSDLLKEFIEYKRQNRYDYTTAAYHLNKYLAFSTSHAPEESIPSKDSKNIFLNRYAGTPRNIYNIAVVLREFSKYLIGLGYMSAYIIPLGKVSLPMPVQPYLFTAEELDAFFKACDSIKYDCHVPKRHIVLPTMYRLLYCCGLRCKEVRVLQSENVHLAENYIDILQSKGPKSRRIFISQE